MFVLLLARLWTVFRKRRICVQRRKHWRRFGRMKLCHALCSVWGQVSLSLSKYLLLHIRSFTHTCTYIRTYIHSHLQFLVCNYDVAGTCIHTFTHTFMHTYIYTYIHTYICTYIQFGVCSYDVRGTCIHTFTHTLICTFIYAFLHTY